MLAFSLKHRCALAVLSTAPQSRYHGCRLLVLLYQHWIKWLCIKELLVEMNRELPPDSADPLSSMKRFNVFQLLVLVLRPTFTVLVQSAVFSKKAVGSVLYLHYMLVNTVEHLAAKEPDISLWSWWGPKTELRGEWILNLHSPGGHDCKWKIILLCIFWKCKKATANMFDISSWWNSFLGNTVIRFLKTTTLVLYQLNNQDTRC